MKYANFLKDKGKIGFVAPSFGAMFEPYKTQFENAICNFNKLNYETIIGPNVYKEDGLGKSTNAKDCAKEVEDFYTNDICDVIISAGGGETMCEDLEFIDFHKLKEAVPKWYMGYSDNTNLTFLLPTICDTAAIYGPCASSFGSKKWHKCLEYSIDLLKGKNFEIKNYDKWELNSLKDATHPFEEYNLTEDYKQIVFNPKEYNLKSGLENIHTYKESSEAQFSGRLLGGCLDCLNIICGTKFDKVDAFIEKYKNDGIVWFLEACELDPMGIWRVLWQLDKANWFKYTKGFLIGRAMKFNEEAFGLNRINAVVSILANYNVPIIVDVDLGHLPPMLPLVVGSVVNVKAKDNNLDIKMELC